MSAVIDNRAIPASKYIFNHDIMNCTAEGIAGNHLYSGRALGVTEPWDIIQLHPELETEWSAITEHYQRIGLNHTHNVIWNVDRKELGAHIGYYPSVFYLGEQENRHWGDHRWMDTVDFINSKNNFMALAEMLDIDTPRTFCFNNVMEIGTAELRKVVYPCYCKAAISVSGVGIYRCNNEAELIVALQNFGANIPIQIQEEVNSEAFLNLQYRVVGDKLVRLEASEQILDGFAHQGNRVPVQHAPWESVEPMAYWLMEHGIKEIFAFDVAVVKTRHGYRYPAIECNPRYNGATYPTIVAQKLGIPEWCAVTLPTRYRHLADIDLRDIEYDAVTGEGAILINWGTVQVGKLAILMAGSQPYQEALSIELEARL